jgi:redox-sensing transcriptional repressor
MAVVRRLPKYYRYLEELLDHGVNRISSKELSERMGITASQIRQDLNCFGGFGQQGYGYNVEYLHKEIGEILGLYRGYTTIIIGAGNLGHALANHTIFEKKGFKLKGIFDVREEIIGEEIQGIKTKHFNEIERFLKHEQIDIAIITVPRAEAPDVAQKLVDLGIKGLWNFVNIDLKITGDVKIENVHLSESLMTLSYQISQS